jgi:hypothetical protein
VFPAQIHGCKGRSASCAPTPRRSTSTRADSLSGALPPAVTPPRWSRHRATGRNSKASPGEI